MREHEVTGQKKKEKAEQSQRVSIQNHPFCQPVMAWDISSYLIGETSFSPSIQRHAALLSETPSAELRAILVKQLQGTYGNQYVQRLVTSIANRARLSVSTPDDPCEREAEQVADQVVRMQGSTGSNEQQFIKGKLASVAEKKKVIQEHVEIKEKQKEEGKVTQSVYWFQVVFVDDGVHAQLQVAAEEVNDATNFPAPADIKVYEYIASLPWAFADKSKLIEIEDAEDSAGIALELAREAIKKCDLDEGKQKAAYGNIQKIGEAISSCFSGRRGQRRQPVIQKSDAEELYLKDSPMGGLSRTIDFLKDEVLFEGGARPAETPTTGEAEKAAPIPKIDNPIIVDGFKFNGYALPEKGRGREQLNILYGLDAKAKARIKITRIKGHTDKVPVRKPGSTIKSLEDLSRARIRSVADLLINQGKFSPPEKVEAIGDKEANVDPSATNAERSIDRKVEVYWEWKSPE